MPPPRRAVRVASERTAANRQNIRRSLAMIRSTASNSVMLHYIGSHPWPYAALVLGGIVVSGLIMMFAGGWNQ